jgi:multidrug resistance efflux pump
MLIVLLLYALLMYVIFGKLKLLPWNTMWKFVVGFGGLIIALVVIGALHYLAPAGKVTVQGATIEVTPNVAGTVVEVTAEPGRPIKTGDLLFRIDPEPFQTEVARLEAAVVEAQTAADMRLTDLAAVEAELQGLQIQLEFGQQRRDDITKLADRGVNSQFQLQEAVATIDQLEANIRAARARKQGLELRIASRIDGVDTAVVQAQKSLAAARWKLEQTSVYASGDGVVTAVSLRPGDRVSILRSAMAFVPDGDRALTGVFSQSGAHALQVGAEVQVAMRAQPGTYFTTTIDAASVGTSEGTISASGALPSIGQLLGDTYVAVRLKIPDDLPPHVTALGSTGAAMLITPQAGPIMPIAKILFWITRYTNYL